MKRFKMDKFGQIPLIQESFVILTFIVMAIVLIVGIIHFR